MPKRSNCRKNIFVGTAAADPAIIHNSTHNQRPAIDTVRLPDRRKKNPLMSENIQGSNNGEIVSDMFKINGLQPPVSVLG